MEGAMVRIPEDCPRPVVSTITPRRKPRGQGRLVRQGTVLALVMTQRNIRKIRVAAVLCCSDRQLYNYLARLRPIPVIHLGALCDLMDMDPEELVDERNYLLEA
jgi:hypothetical protein